jgi:hypothetical protein
MSPHPQTDFDIAGSKKRLQQLVRAAFVHLRRARDNKPPLEVRMRLEKFLEEFESEAGLKK